MVKSAQTSSVSRRAYVRYGLGAVCIGIVMLMLWLSFSKAAQGVAAPLAPATITIGKVSTTSIIGTNNNATQAVAGELVTVTVVYTISAGESLSSVSPRVLLQDGLLPYASTPAWSTMVTGTANTLRATEPRAARDGALVVFPDQGDITGPQVLTMIVYARRLQRQYVGTGEIGNGSNLRVQAVLRWSTSYAEDDSPNGQVTAVNPQITTGYPAPVYLDAGGVGEGGGQVRLTFTAAADSGRPTAYDIVYTATLGSGLTYVSSYGAGVGAGTVSTVGGVTYVVWNLPVSLVNPQTWQAVVTATLPSPFTVGQEFSYQGRAAYETFAGDMPYEGKYSTAGAEQKLRPGVGVTKFSVPGGGAVTMGDWVTYTVIIRQGANTLLQAPQVVDTQPLGFHYRADTLVVQGATVTSVAVVKGAAEGSGSTARYYEDLRWTLADLPAISTARLVTATYVTLNTGLDYDGLAVYWTANDIKSLKPTINTNRTGAVLSWTPPAGSAYSSAPRANAGALGVIQPFMGENFSTVRFDAGNREVGQDLTFITRFRNNGYSGTGISAIPAYELQVCDTLPAGIIFQADNGCFNTSNSTACSFSYTPPAQGETGEVCYTIPVLEKSNNTYEFRYVVRVTDGVYPGTYSNRAFVRTYSSKPGTVEGERIYADFPEALPVATCGANCYTILGLAGSKTSPQTLVAPGSLITYVLAYTDTSNVNNYTGLVLTDTYDSLLTYVTATPAPTAHHEAARELRWNLGNLPANSSGQIVLRMRVASEVAARYVLTNTMFFDSDQTSLRSWVKTTPIAVANLFLAMSGPADTHADGEVVYTVVYSNTGSWNNAPVTITLDYGPYLSYVSASLAPVAGTNNRVFVDTVPNNGVSEVLTINLRTNAPLPYTLEEISSTVGLASPGAPSRATGWTMPVRRPVFAFRKFGPPAAAPVGQTMQYTFELINTGDYTATSLVITDTWDTATSFRSSPGWTVSGDGKYATYAIPSLAPGATVDVNPLTVGVDSLRDSYLNQADLSSRQTTSQHTELLLWAHSIALDKTAYPVPAFPGRVLTYTLYYTNTGAGVVAAVVTDTLPQGFSYQGQSVEAASGCSTGWNFIFNSPYATWSCTALQTSAKGYFRIWGVVTAAENSVLVNNAESDGADIPTRPLDEPLSTLVARPWLHIGKAAVPTHPVAPGDVVTYTLTYTNSGSYAAYDVVIKDRLPTQLTFGGCDPVCAHSGGLVTWNIGHVPTGTVAAVTVYATVNAGTGGQAAINADYTIENTTVWQQLTPEETARGGPVTTTILNPQLALSKAAEPTIVPKVNDFITYTIRYTNTGGGLLHNILITDTLDEHTAFYAAPGCSHTGEAAGGTVTCAVGGLANGASGQVVIVVRMLSGLQPGGKVLNQAQARSTETAPITSNTTTVWYQVSGTPHITVTPTSIERLVKAGTTAAFDVPLIVTNSGQVPLTWAVVENPTVAWLSESSTGGNLNAGASTTVMLTFNPAGLAVGDHTTSLVFTSGAEGNTVNVQVTLRVRAPVVAAAPAGFAYTVTVGSAAFTAPLFITNAGEVPLTWTLSESPSVAWLSQSPTNGNLNAGAAIQVTVTFAKVTTVGTYQTTLRITTDAGGNTIDIPVRLHVYETKKYIFLPLVLRSFGE